MADRGRCSPAFSHNDPSLVYALEDPKGWNSCWAGFKCFSPRRREKYRRAETHLAHGPMSVQSSTEEDESLALDVLTQVTILPPMMCAPPSSPVSFGGNGQSASSHVTLLTRFPENSERLPSQPELRFDAYSTDAHAGLFMLDDALVTPPLYSTLTTASITPLSTAPFTPPPELAHLTTPSSPEVPFAQLLGPSSEFHSSLSEKVHEHLSMQSFPPNNLKLIHQLYHCSSNGQFVRETLPPVPKMEKGSTNSKLVLQQKAKDAGLLEQDGAYSPTIAHDSSEYNYWQGRQNSEECCPTCGELSVKCKDLSEALEQTKQKLTLVERRVNSIDERERKFKQLMQWMQLGDKFQQQNSFQSSKELTWQESVFSDLPECNRAESSIRILNTGDDDS